MLRNAKAYGLLFLKGMLMGAADSVPGVSGGTMAFITGIYEELINSLRSIDLAALKLLFTRGPKAAWKKINGSFLLVLVMGILVSVFTMARGVQFLLHNYPVLLWAFFFGLVAASVWSVTRQVKHWNYSLGTSFVLGALLAYLICSLSPSVLEPTPGHLFMAGMIAICAMILPGISGSFILLLLGIYAPILAAVTALQISTLLIFAGGCVVGLLCFSRVLSWAFAHHHQGMLALLSGFMLGSLVKIWPWKVVVSYVIDRHGGSVPLVEHSVWPDAFAQYTGQSGHLWGALALMATGMALVLVVERRNR